jgi:hypothetical protein
MPDSHGRKRLGLLLVTAVGLIGCQPRSEVSAPVAAGELPAVVLDTPENTARSALLSLRAHLRAIARQDEPATRECLAQMRTLAAEASIKRTLARRPRFSVLVGNDPIEGYIDNWGAAIAYYAGVSGGDDSFHFERMHRISQTPTRVAVGVPASGPDDDALIQVTCVREDDGLWRVSRIEFVVETTSTRPAAPPASQP